MNCKSMIDLCMLFILVPVWIGIIWVEALRLKWFWNRVIHAWVLGFVTMLAAGQLVLVPLVALQQAHTTALMVWKIILTVLAVISMYMVLFRWQRKFCSTEGRKDISVHKNTEQAKDGGMTDRKERRGGWTIAFCIVAAVLILLQAYIPARYEHRDDDDSRFVSEEVSAVVHDTMYQDNPITAEYLYWNEGEVRKDFTSPWAMYIAFCCRISSMEPAVLSHSYLPFFLILICYAAYFLIGKELFKNDLEKTYLFLIFLSVIHLWGYTSTHTLASMLLLRIWQGKAVCASLMLPVLFYIMYRVMKKEYKKGWIVFAYVAATASCLLSGIGIVTAPIMFFIYGIVDFMYYRNWKKTAAIWGASLPCAVFLLYYLLG